MKGEADIAAVASVLADPGRARILLALADGRALPASVLASEAGVAASTASAHLSKMADSGLITVTRQGRHRYHRMAGPEVGELLEALARVAPETEIRSLRQGTRANAVRTARTCYDHLAGRLGTGLMASLLESGRLEGGDGRHRTELADRDRLSAPGVDVEYRLTPGGREDLTRFGIDLEALESRRRPAIRYCVDWSEQRHHLAGGLGAALAERMFELGWIVRAETHRAVRVSDDGRAGLRDVFGLRWDP